MNLWSNLRASQRNRLTNNSICSAQISGPHSQKRQINRKKTENCLSFILLSNVQKWRPIYVGIPPDHVSGLHLQYTSITNLCKSLVKPFSQKKLIHSACVSQISHSVYINSFIVANTLQIFLHLNIFIYKNYIRLGATSIGYANTSLWTLCESTFKLF